MKKKFNSHSIFFSDDLKEAFDFTSETISRIILKGHLNIITNEKLLKEINGLNKLKYFLGKKREPSQILNQNEMDELKEDLNNIEPEKITISESNKAIKIEIDDKNKFHIKINLLKQLF